MVILVPVGKFPIIPQIKKRTSSSSTRFIHRCLLKTLSVDATHSDLLKLSAKMPGGGFPVLGSTEASRSVNQ